MRAVWNNTVIAESDETVVVEGNHYFPHASIRWDLLEATEKTTVCPWKGTASYWSIALDGARFENAAWSYPHPKPAAANIAGRVAFWSGVNVTP